MKKAITFLVCNLLIGGISAQPTVDAERQRIESERAAAQAGFDLQSNACYKKFWVNDCLDDVKAKRLEVISDLRRQEVSLNDQERKAKSAEQLQKLEEKASVANELNKQNERAEAVKKAQARTEREANKAAATPFSAPAPSPKSDLAAQSKQIRQAQKQASQLEKQSQAADQLEKYDAKQKKAEARQAKRRLEQEAQKTKKQAAPLPPGGAP